MECREIIDILERHFPVSYACDWDNIGLLVGAGGKEVNCIYVALDASEEVIEAAVRSGADMLITHHPLLFSAVKQIVEEDFIGRRIRRLIREDISYYALHTNYDITAMADTAAKMLGLTGQRVLEPTCSEALGIGRVGELGTEMTLHECALLVKTIFQIPDVKVFGDLEVKVKTAAISPGSGKGMADYGVRCGAQVLITGDIDHHEGIDAVAKGIAVIDAGHYGLECIFMDQLSELLAGELNEVSILCEQKRIPFQTL